MRHMAPAATFNTNTGVLVNKRTPLVYMALQTGLFVIVRGSQHRGANSGSPRCRGGAMRVVAISALDHSFVHPMLHRHLKLCPGWKRGRYNKAASVVSQAGTSAWVIYEWNGNSKQTHVSLRMSRTPDHGARNVF